MGQQQLLLIIVGVIIIGIAIAVGINLFSAQSMQSNKDAIISDINVIAADAYQFKMRPSSMGGGAGSFVGYTVPTKMIINPNASYGASNQDANGVTITGTSVTYSGTVTAQVMSNGLLSFTGFDGF